MLLHRSTSRRQTSEERIIKRSSELSEPLNTMGVLGYLFEVTGILDVSRMDSSIMTGKFPLTPATNDRVW
jgi:hypothetical protein